MKKLLKKILFKIQDKEVEKPIEKMNPDIIRICTDLILKLDGVAPLTEEEIRERVEKIFPTNK